MENGDPHRVPSIQSAFLLALALPALSLACSLLGGAATATPTVEEKPTATDIIPTNTVTAVTPVLSGPLSIGTPFLICDTAVTVLGWENVPPGEYFKPESGNRFIAVEVVLVNLGEDPFETSSFAFWLLDAFDEEIPVGLFPMALAHGTILTGGLAPGERARGKAGYEAPEEEQEFTLRVSCSDIDELHYEEWFFDLGSKPRSVPAPGRFEGETLPESLPAGNSALVHSVEITVNEVLPFPESFFDPDSRPRVSPPFNWMKYIIVDLTLVNQGTDAVELCRLTDMYARDLEGWRFLTIGWAAQALDDPIGEYITLEPGEMVDGQVVLQIPADSAPMYFVFEFGYGRKGERAYFLMI